MKAYSWISKVGKSLVPSEFYIQILQEPLWRAFSYMGLFILLLSVLTGGYQGYLQKEGYQALLATYNQQEIPDFTLTPKGLEIEGHQPIVIRFLGFSIILDDQQVYTINDIIGEEKAILFDHYKVTLVNKGIEPISYTYAKLFQLTFANKVTAADIAASLPLLSFLAIPVSIFAQFLFSLFRFIYDGVFILLIINIIRTLLGLGIRLKQLIHMTTYAMTFSIFWTHFLDILPASIPYTLDTLVYYGVPSFILFNVFLYIRKKSLEEFNHPKKKP